MRARQSGMVRFWILAGMLPMLMGCPSQTTKPRDVAKQTPTAQTKKSPTLPKTAPPVSRRPAPKKQLEPMDLVLEGTEVPATVDRDGGFVKLSFAQAVLQGRASEKNVVLYLFTPWCGPCKQLSAKVFPTPEFKEFGRTVVAIKVDAATDEGKPVAEAYGVNSYPTTIVLAPSGEEIERFFGFHPTAEYIQTIRDYAVGRNTTDDYKKRASMAPDNIDLNFQAGRELAIRKRGPEAIAFLERAIELDPDNKTGKVPRALLLLANTVYIEQLKAYEKAMPLLERLSKNHPTTFHGKEATYMMARAFIEQKQVDKAKMVLLEQVVIAPHDGIQYHRFGTFCLRYRLLYSEAMEKIDEGLIQHPKAAYLWKVKADLAFRMKRYDEAEGALEKAMALQPKNKTYKRLLDVYKNAQKTKKGTQ